jgi:hypothetical protein
MRRVLFHIGLLLACARMTQAGEYLFEAYFCEVDAKSVETRSWTISTGLIANVSTFVDHETARALVETYADDVVSFPVLRLSLGEKAAVNEQEPVRYGVEFNDDGEATRHEEAGVGLRIEAELIEEQPNRVRIEFLVEQRWLEYWLPYTTPSGAEFRMPAFGSRSWNTAMYFTLDQWLWLSGLSRTRDEERRYQITLLRVRPAN